MALSFTVTLQLKLLAAQARLAWARGAEQLLQQTSPGGVSAKRALYLMAAELELAAGNAAATRARLETFAAPTRAAIDDNRLLAADLRAAADLAEGRSASAQVWYTSAPARLAGDENSHRGPRDEVLARIA